MRRVQDAGAAVQRAHPALVPGRHPQPGARPAAPTAHRPSGEGRSPAQPGTRGGLEAAGAPGGPAALACRHLPLPRPHPTRFPHHKPQTCTCGSPGQARAREAAGTGSRGHSEQPKLVLKQKPAEAGVSPPTWNCGWQRPTNRAQPPALRTLQSLGSLGPQDPASRPGRCTERPPRPPAPGPNSAALLETKLPGPRHPTFVPLGDKDSIHRTTIRRPLLVSPFLHPQTTEATAQASGR